MQSRMLARHGLLVGSLLTCLPVAVYHMPLSFGGDWTWANAGIGLALVFGLVPFYRYLLGMHLLDTRGSLLAVGLQHAQGACPAALDLFLWDVQRSREPPRSTQRSERRGGAGEGSRTTSTTS